MLIDYDERELRKFYVNGVTVGIAAETVYELDSSGKKVRAVKYTDYTGEQVRTLFPHAALLRQRWTESEGRSAVVQALADRGITADALAEATGQPDADPLDLLIHVAWQGPLKSRRERAERVRRDAKSFFDQFTERARQVLNDLLDRYAEHGVQELDDLHILEVPPICERGTVVEIARAFGDAERLRTAMEDLQRLLYAA